MNAETLKALAARVQAATGGDRELDAAIMRALDPKFAALENSWAHLIHEYTSSLDAALGLVTRVMGSRIGPITLTVAGSGEALICSNDPCGWSVQEFGPTPALALLSAMLAALTAEQKETTDER